MADTDVALIIGGGPGISASCARLFVQDCMKVALHAGYYGEPGGRVDEFMSTQVRTIDADTSILDLARAFLLLAIAVIGAQKHGLLITKGGVETAAFQAGGGDQIVDRRGGVTLAPERLHDLVKRFILIKLPDGDQRSSPSKSSGLKKRV